MSLHYTELVYGGVEVENVVTRAFNSELLFGEDGVDVLGVRKSFEYEGLITSPIIEDAQENIAEKIQDLQKPRQGLLIRFSDGVTPISFVSVSAARSGNDNADTANGPMSEVIEGQELFGGRALRIRGRITWTERAEPNSGEDPPVVVGHRFSQQFSVDRDGYATRVVSGELTLSGRQATINPDDFRCHVWPQPMPGAQRESAEFVVKSDGLGLVYRVVDRERYRPLPNGVTEAAGVYEAEIIGAVVRKTVNFKLVGPKYMNKARLVLAAYRVLVSRIDVDNDVLERIVFREDLWGENAVSVACVAISGGTKVDADGNPPLVKLKLWQDVAPELVPQDNNFTALGPYGTGLVKAAYQALFRESEHGTPLNFKWEGADNGGTAYEPYAQVSVITQELAGAEAPLGGDSNNDGNPDGPCVRTDNVVAAQSITNLGDEVATLRLGSEPTKVGDIQSGGAPLVKYSVSRRRMSRPSVMVVPVASFTETPHVQPMGSPVVYDVIQGEIQRLRVPPVVPTPEDLLQAPGKHVLVDASVDPEAEIMSDGGTLTYRATFMYVLQRVFDPNDSAEFQVADIALPGGTVGVAYAKMGTVKYPGLPVLTSDGQPLNGNIQGEPQWLA